MSGGQNLGRAVIFQDMTNYKKYKNAGRTQLSTHIARGPLLVCAAIL